MILLSSAVISPSGVLGPVSAVAGLFERKAPLGDLFVLGCESLFAPQLEAADTNGTPNTPHKMSRTSGLAEEGDEFTILGRGMIRFTGGPPSSRSFITAFYSRQCDSGHTLDVVLFIATTGEGEDR